MWLFGHISRLFGQEILSCLLAKNATTATGQRLFMTMCMVHVRHMWVDVLHRLMFVKMCMRLAWGVDGTVRMTMVFIMHVRMGVAYGRMEVLMFMVLSQVQSHSDCHQ
jgi:hypothetical protein